ncbi:uncharacterized protein LOC111483290 isoform X2 [Cucurbita maxima]|uniref:Uncharacterized protein LOC111483290 isoform X2 n=1 Tax=Cucurbita maxima TaxID=3661 RepID=A0A6J1J4C1_CUCMA|nr:uncharacterized protein LOC111483290 isoform X2 [Cucurbita maxima]
MLTGLARGASMVAAEVGVLRRRFQRTPPLQSPEHCYASSTSFSARTSSSSSPLSAKPIVAEDNDLVMEAGEPLPRLVFGGVPSFEEAKEATAELKEVLDAMCLSSPKYFESDTSLIPGISLSLNNEMVDNGFGVIMANDASNPGREHVLEAFRLLSCSSKIQNIVSAVACDQNVFKAVLENSDVKELIQTYKTSSGTEDEGDVTEEGESGARVVKKLRNMKDFLIKMVSNIPSRLPGFLHGFSAMESANGSSAMESAYGSDHKESITMKARKFGSGCVEKLRNLKNSAVEVATKIPNFVPNWYGSSGAGGASGSDHEGNAQRCTPEMGLGTSLTGLAIMVIMIVVFKRI